MLSFLKELWALIRPYWKSDQRWRARALLASIIALNLGEVYLNVRLNKWNNDFYDALQAYDKEGFFHALIVFGVLASIFLVVAVYKNYLRQMLSIKWRQWMTSYYLNHWLDRQNYYRLQVFGSTADNPDQRISDDIGQFIGLTLDLSLGLLSSVVTLVSFLGILWGLSGAWDFEFFGIAFHIPGYMVWAALLYSGVGTLITIKIGKPLVGLNYNQQRYEADFRFALVRAREHSESIAFYQGEAQENTIFHNLFSAVFGNNWKIIKRQKKLNWFTAGYPLAATVFPFIVAAPAYFSKKIALGGLMQTASAFGQVQGSLSFMVDAYTTVASWQAVTDRLSGFKRNMANAQTTKNTISRMHTADSALSMHGVTIRLPNNEVVLENIDLVIDASDSLLIMGPSGSGKSTLLRTLAGIWPYAEGTITIPQNAQVLFVPQKSYLPLGTLRQAICYPAADADKAAIEQVLSACGLLPLMLMLEESGNWSQTLSLGEQQRLSFARILLMKPDFVFLDEATSALDEAMELYLYTHLKNALPNTAIITAGHRSTLRQFHQSTMEIKDKHLMSL